MEPERWQRIQDLFARALARGEGGADFLRAVAGDDPELRDEALSLLRAHGDADQEAFLETRDGGPRGVHRGDVDGLPELDRYHWLDRLGEGGMGSVYLAVRSDDAYQQRVAIKLLRRDLGHAGLIRRFRRERQILADLEHPNIARLIDGGTASDGRPFLVMEYVDGEPIDRYCRRLDLGIADRLRLVIKVCAAVHAAHQRLVVHRDLKPANILVGGDGEPKLLDFGIAKLLDAGGGPRTVMATAAGQTPMTPEYASPEQARGLAVTTASDVYSLGVLLYELLAGRRPLQLRGLAADRALGRLLEETPTRPSRGDLDPHQIGRRAAKNPERWQRKLAGDLDTILLMALAKEPSRRYGSAQGLAADLDRHLRGLPVTARGESLTYLAGRFVRRHRWPVTIAAAALAGQSLLTVGLALQRAETARQRDRATAVSETLVEIFETADPGRARGELLTARSVLDSGLRRIDALADPQLQADLQATMGRVYTSLGLPAPALELLREALETRRRVHGGDHPAVAEAMELLALALHDADRGGEARGLLEEALASRLRLHGPDDVRVARPHVLLASALDRLGEREDARWHYGRGVALLEAGDDPVALARALNAFGTLERDHGDYPRAVALHRRAVEGLRAAHGEVDDPELAWALTNLGAALRLQGTYAGAETVYRRAESMQRRLYDGSHPLLAYTLDQLGLLRLAQARGGGGEAQRVEEWRAQAEAFLTEALEQRRAVFGDLDARVADSHANLAKVHLDRGDLDAAEAGFGRALDILKTVLPAGHKDLAAAMNHRAEAHVRRGELQQAEALFEGALEIQRRHFGEGHRSVALVLSNLARCVAGLGDHDRAVALREESVAILRRQLGPRHPDLAALLYNLGVSYHYAGRLDRAAASYREALAVAEAALGPEHGLVDLLQGALGTLPDAEFDGSKVDGGT
ncbi:MAG: serine/threonine-protein kinase [Acidobacteriota bacterium]